MAPIIYAVLLHLLLRSEASESEKCFRDQGTVISWEKQLHHDLIEGADTLIRPPSNKTEPLTVNLRFILKNFQFVSQEEVFSIYTWIFASWKDERLQWDPAKYGGLKKTELSTLNVWSPMFTLYNSADEYDSERFFYALCKLNFKGDVSCVRRTSHETACSVKLSNWPYDRQECSVVYGSYDSQGCLNLSFSGRAVSMIGAEYGAEWMIVDYEQVENHNSEKQLEMIFTLEREAVTLAALIIYPSYVLVALTLGALWLDVRCDTRLYMVCFSLFCHCFFISELGVNIPKESFDSPTIILYYRGSEILTVINFLLTMALRVSCKKVSQPLTFVSSVNDIVFNSFARFLIYPKWESVNTRIVRLGEDDFSQDWTKLANILNSMFIIIFVIVYICLYILFMPQPYPIIY